MKIALLLTCLAVMAEAQSPDRAVRIIEKKDVEFAYPHWSKDGRSILFQSNESGRWQLYRMDTSGRNIVQLTNDASNNNFPDWSTATGRILFVSDRTGDEEIFVMDADGKNQKQLTSSAGRDIHPYWSPKGDKVWFNSTRDNPDAFDIYEMNPDGSDVRRITESPDDETCARQSPVGNTIVYLKNNGRGLDDVFTMSLADRTEKNITNTPSTNGWPCWTRDGDGVIYSGIEDGRYKLFVINLKDGTIRRLTNPPSPYFDARPNISADGKWMVFNRQIDGARNTIGIYIMELKN